VFDSITDDDTFQSADSGLVFAYLDRIVEALEKQVHYKPQEYEDRYYACKCDNILLRKWEKYPEKLTPKEKGLPYCLCCGQKLDWSDDKCV
jgi:hypothetical protein